MRVVVITGGTSGIGKECAEYFSERGDTVVVLARKPVGGVKNFYMCDVSINQMVHDVFAQINKKFGKIDVLINNAGYGVSGATEIIKEEVAREIFDVNYFGALNCIRNVLPFMPKTGRIINISSIVGFFPMPYRAFYAASKAALNSLSASVDAELKPYGIRSVAVCPGDVATNFGTNRVKNFETNERYGDRVENATMCINEDASTRMPPIKVAKAVYKVSLKRDPKPYTIVGRGYRTLYVAGRIFRPKTVHKVLGKIFDGRKPKKKK